MVIVDSEVPKVIIRQGSLYLNADDTVYIDNHLFEKDVENEDEMEDDGQQTVTLHAIKSLCDAEIFNYIKVPDFLVFKAPSRAFSHVDWEACNASMCA